MEDEDDSSVPRELEEGFKGTGLTGYRRKNDVEKKKKDQEIK